jgi:hypothetical protein
MTKKGRKKRRGKGTKQSGMKETVKQTDRQIRLDYTDRYRYREINVLIGWLIG